MKKRKWIWIGLAVILIASVLLLSNPHIRTNLFVRIYHEQIEEGLKMHAGVPADDAVLFGYKYVNTWEGGTFNGRVPHHDQRGYLLWLLLLAG